LKKKTQAAACVFFVQGGLEEIAFFLRAEKLKIKVRRVSGCTQLS